MQSYEFHAQSLENVSFSRRFGGCRTIKNCEQHFTVNDCRNNLASEGYMPEIVFGERLFLLTVGASLLTVELLCLQSLKALLRRTFPL